jgi:hypothetical protein
MFVSVTLSSTGNSRLTFSLSGTQPIGSASDGFEIRTSRTVTHGTGEGQANAGWRNRVTIPAGQVLGLNLLELEGSALNYAGIVAITKLKEIFCVVRTTTAGAHVLFGVISPSDITGYSARVGRGGDYRWADYLDGLTITESVNNWLYIANPTGAGVEIDIAFMGVGTYSDNA